ncbi:hypothetical protein SCA6_014307 [Theobroma cacao]
MSSKTFILLSLLAAVVLLISSEVAARDLAETTTKINNAEEALETTDVGTDDAKYGGYEGRGGYGGYGGYGGRSGYGGYGGRGGYGGYGGRGGSGGRCAFGCCRSDYYGRGCRRCCSYSGEAIDVETHGDPHN